MQQDKLKGVYSDRPSRVPKDSIVPSEREMNRKTEVAASLTTQAH